MPYQLSLPAQDDLERLITVAAEGSRRRAEKILTDFLQAFDQVSSYPQSGEAWAGQVPGLRVKRVKPGWLVFYRDVPPEEVVSVVRILRATEDLELALADLTS